MTKKSYPKPLKNVMPKRSAHNRKSGSTRRGTNCLSLNLPLRSTKKKHRYCLRGGCLKSIVPELIIMTHTLLLQDAFLSSLAIVAHIEKCNSTGAGMCTNG